MGGRQGSPAPVREPDVFAAALLVETNQAPK